MSLGIALSCKADLGTTPISSVPYVISMFTNISIGHLTIIMNLLFIIAQPIVLKSIHWVKIIGQGATLMIFGHEIDLCMYLLDWLVPQNHIEMWGICVLGAAALAIGVFLCIKADVFTAAGDGLVLAIEQVTHRDFAFLKNCFDGSLVIVCLIISFSEFGELRGVGAGTIAAALLVGRIVRICEEKLTFFDRWTAAENAEG